MLVTYVTLHNGWQTHPIRQFLVAVMTKHSRISPLINWSLRIRVSQPRPQLQPLRQPLNWSPLPLHPSIRQLLLYSMCHYPQAHVHRLSSLVRCQILYPITILLISKIYTGSLQMSWYLCVSGKCFPRQLHPDWTNSTTCKHSQIRW